MGGEYTAQVVVNGMHQFLLTHARPLLRNQPPIPDPSPILAHEKVKALAAVVPPRPPGFCIGCPERPIFAALKLAEKELGAHHVSADIGCHLFSILPPFNIGGTTMGYGLGPASASAFNVPANKRAISIMGDGGFWHNGLASSVGNAVFNKQDTVIVVVDNFLLGCDGRAGHSVVACRKFAPKDQELDCRGGEGCRRHMGEADRSHLRRRSSARHISRGVDDEGVRPEDRGRLLGVHA